MRISTSFVLIIWCLINGWLAVINNYAVSHAVIIIIILRSSITIAINIIIIITSSNFARRIGLAAFCGLVYDARVGRRLAAMVAGSGG